FHQSRFAGAILTSEGDHFTRADFEINALESAHATEAFLDPSHLEDGNCHPSALALSFMLRLAAAQLINLLRERVDTVLLDYKCRHKHLFVRRSCRLITS